MSTLGVAVLSFNRPHYLRQVLESLENQTDADFEVVLFQDGAVNVYSHIEYAQQSVIDECVDMFWSKNFNKSPLCPAHSWNIGIAENHYRAKQEMFQHYDRVLFLEDDMIISKHYIHLIKVLLQQTLDTPAGIVMASGHQKGPKDCQEKLANLNKLKTGRDHKWGYAMWGNIWHTIKPVFDEYYNLVKNRDYRRRPGVEIVNMFKDMGCNIGATSQDGAMDMSLYLNDMCLVNTEVNRARYIGEVGQHATPDNFRKTGWDKVILDEFRIDKDRERFDEPDWDGLLKEYQRKIGDKKHENIAI